MARFLGRRLWALGLVAALLVLLLGTSFGDIHDLDHHSRHHFAAYFAAVLGVVPWSIMVTHTGLRCVRFVGNSVVSALRGAHDEDEENDILYLPSPGDTYIGDVTGHNRVLAHDDTLVDAVTDALPFDVSLLNSGRESFPMTALQVIREGGGLPKYKVGIGGLSGSVMMARSAVPRLRSFSATTTTTTVRFILQASLSQLNGSHDLQQRIHPVCVGRW